METYVLYTGNMYSQTDWIDLQVSSGGGGGSVAHGTLITMSDRSRVPVQNINPGDRILAWDFETMRTIAVTVQSIDRIETTTLLIIQTTAPMPLRVDLNPALKLHVIREGQVALVPVTELEVGDPLFHFESQTWVPITLLLTQSVRNTVYDLHPDPLVSAYIANGYADPCPCKDLP